MGKDLTVTRVPSHEVTKANTKTDIAKPEFVGLSRPDVQQTKPPALQYQDIAPTIREAQSRISELDKQIAKLKPKIKPRGMLRRLEEWPDGLYEATRERSDLVALVNTSRDLHIRQMQREKICLENDIRQEHYESDIREAFYTGEEVPNPKRRRWFRS